MPLLWKSGHSVFLFLAGGGRGGSWDDLDTWNKTVNREKMVKRGTILDTCSSLEGVAIPQAVKIQGCHQYRYAEFLPKKGVNPYSVSAFNKNARRQRCASVFCLKRSIFKEIFENWYSLKTMWQQWKSCVANIAQLSVHIEIGIGRNLPSLQWEFWEAATPHLWL